VFLSPSDGRFISIRTVSPKSRFLMLLSGNAGIFFLMVASFNSFLVLVILALFFLLEESARSVGTSPYPASLVSI